MSELVDESVISDSDSRILAENEDMENPLSHILDVKRGWKKIHVEEVRRLAPDDLEDDYGMRLAESYSVHENFKPEFYMHPDYPNIYQIKGIPSR
jgi:hypothetical protein